MWRHKRLWLFGLIGYALTAIGYGLYLTMTLNWQSRWFELMSRTMQTQGYTMPDALMGPMLRQLAWLGVGLGVLFLAAFAGYIINLVIAVRRSTRPRSPGAAVAPTPGAGYGPGRADSCASSSLIWCGGCQAPSSSAAATSSGSC